MSTPLYEQETVINFSRNSDTCTVYTSDTTVMTKLDKLVDSDKAPEWSLLATHRLPDGDIVGKTYKTVKRLISFRSNIITRELTEEQREAAAERFRKIREQKKQKTDSDQMSEVSQIIDEITELTLE